MQELQLLPYMHGEPIPDGPSSLTPDTSFLRRHKRALVAGTACTMLGIGLLCRML